MFTKKYSSKSQPRHRYNSLSTNSLQDDDNVDFTDFASVFEYGFSAVHKDINEDDSFLMEMYVNVVRDIATDLKHFDLTKHDCAVCGGKNHSFADCPELLNSKLKEAYIKICLTANGFLNVIRRLDNMNGNKYKGGVNLLRTCNLHSLDHLSQVPSHATPFTQSDDGRLNSLEAKLNTVATAASKSSDVILDLHQVVLSSKRTATNDDGPSVSLNSLRDFLDNNEDFWTAVKRK